MDKVRKFKLKKERLSDKIFITFCLLSLIQITIVGFVMLVSNYTILYSREKQNLTQLLTVVNQDIESRIGAINSIALDLAINSKIKDNLNIKDEMQRGIGKRQISELLSGKVISVDGVLDISILDMDGNTYSVRGNYTLPSDFKLTESEVYQTAIKGQGNLVWVSHNDISERYLMDSFTLNPLQSYTAVASIIDFRRGQILGIIIIALDSDYFYSIDYSGKKIDGVSVYLVSPDKTAIYHVNYTDIPLSPFAIEQIELNSDNGFFATTDEKTGEKRMVTYLRNEAMTWNMVCTSSVSAITQTFRLIIVILFVTLFLSFLFCLLLSKSISTQITVGLKQLVSCMKSVEEGDLSVQIPPFSPDEIGELGTNFENMLREIRDLIKKRYEQELLTKEAEFKALQAQINPHFLYNTLDMINWKLVENGQMEISNAIVSLGKLLRYSVNGSGTKSNLAKELENISDYLATQQIGNRVQFRYTVDTVREDEIILPKLTLQPLVENAILHGFGRRRSGNLLELHAYEDGNLSVIDIVDNGVGFENELYGRLPECSNEAHSEPMDQKVQIGIKNVDMRLKYMFGEEYGITISSRFGYGTTVRIRLPNTNIRSNGEKDEGSNH